VLGYCTQVDAFPPGFTGLEFVRTYQRLSGCGAAEADERAWRALERTGMDRVAHRKVGGYSKGMRQRIKLAQSIAHEPPVLLLDEPLNGLDPLARAEIIDLFRVLAREGLHLVISSHILHEVDMLSDRMVVLDHGYVVAEGGIAEVRAEIEAEPIEIVIQCDRPKELAARIVAEDHVTEIKIEPDLSVVIRTRDASRFYALLQMVVVHEGMTVRSVAPTDEDAQAVYRYLVTGREDTE
jgi:ABC-2 type transport system ATP-binding protein